MKKIILSIVVFSFFIACSSDENSKKFVDKDSEKVVDYLKEFDKLDKAKMTSEDIAIKEWLIGKEWKSESGAAPIEILKIFSNDSCSVGSEKRTHWAFKKGNFGNFGVYWPFIKLDDTSFTLFVKPTNKTYRYIFVKNL